MATESHDNIVPITSAARAEAEKFGAEHDRELLTILFTDLCDSTKLQSDLGNVESARLTELHRKIVREELAKYYAREIEWAGDSCLAVFTKPSDAVVFALKLQAALRKARTEEPNMPAVRIGLHLGEIVVRRNKEAQKDDLFGLQVSEAARVMSLAHGDQIYCTRAVFDNAQGSLKGQPVKGLAEITWHRHGFFELKGSEEPAEVFEVGEEGFAPLTPPGANDKCQPIRGDLEKWRKRRARGERKRRGIPLAMSLVLVLLSLALGAAIMWILSPPRAPAAPTGAAITSLAVLPLDNLMNDAEEDYFVDGMTEAITAELSKISSLKVISRTSAMQYRDTDKATPEIAEELGVSGLVEGSVLRDGDDVRITVQLIDGREDRHVWSESYTNTVTSVLKLQAEVALAIAAAIRAEVAPEERERIADKADVDPDALEAYLRGRQLMRTRTGDDLARAITQFERAVEIDPEYAAAYVGIADIYLLQSSWGFHGSDEVIEPWRVAIERALRLDETLAEAQASYGMGKYLFELDVDTSFAAFRKALQLDPNDARTHHWYGVCLDQSGRTDSALARFDRAVTLDPNSPVIKFSITLALMNARRYTEAESVLTKMLDAYPDFVPGHQALVMLSVAQGHTKEAVAAARRFAQLRNHDATGLVMLAMALAADGQEQPGRENLDRALELARNNQGVVLEDYRALVHLYLGEVDTAQEILARMSVTPTAYLSVNPLFDPIRDDPRYWKSVERLGYPLLPADHPIYPKQHAHLVREEAKRLIEEEGLDGSRPIQSLAVLPLDNYSNDPDQEYFVDGMTDALTAELSKVGSLKVIARTSAMRYKNSDLTIREIGRELGVDGLIEGSVYRSGDGVRITAQLVRSDTEAHVWGQTYEESVENVIALQGRVAVAIVGEVSAALTPEEEQRITFADTTTPEAYDAYLRAQHALRSRSAEAFNTAAGHFKTSIARDPNFAPAYAGLAQVLALRVGYGLGDRNTIIQQSRDYAAKALELNPNLAEAHAALGLTRTSVTAGPEHWKDAERHFRHAIELMPGYALAHSWLGMLYTQMGRLNDGREFLQTGIELDPKGLVPQTLLAENYIYSREYEKADEILSAVLEDDPESLLAVVFLDRMLAGKGYTQARVERLERAMSGLSSTDTFGLGAALAAAHADIGDTEKAQSFADRELRDGPQSQRFTIPAARVWFALGDFETGFEWLTRATEFRSMWAFLRNAPAWDIARDDPRYWELMSDFPPLPPEHPLYEKEQEWLVRLKAEELIRERGLVPVETAN